MSHELESANSMFSVREVPWHGLGKIIQNAPNSREAIKLAELDWTVLSRPIFNEAGEEIKGFKANVRDSDDSILGIVSDKYQIVQNSEAFEFTDNLIDSGDVFYETAGSLRRGKQIWMLAKMPTTSILGDEVEPYICFTNSHDGSGAIKVCMTPTRVVCANTLNLAFSKAKRMWSTKHMGDIAGKLQEAKETLFFANRYMDTLKETADVLATQKVTEAEVEKYLDELFPVDYQKDSKRKIENVQKLKDSWYMCYMMPDIAKFFGTKWGMINATADLVDHVAPARNTKTYQENNWGKIIIGHPVLDAMMKLVSA